MPTNNQATTNNSFWDTQVGIFSNAYNGISSGFKNFISGGSNTASESLIDSYIGTLFNSALMIAQQSTQKLTNTFIGDPIVGQFFSGLVQTMASPVLSIIRQEQLAIIQSERQWIQQYIVSNVASAAASIFSSTKQLSGNQSKATYQSDLLGAGVPQTTSSKNSAADYLESQGQVLTASNKILDIPNYGMDLYNTNPPKLTSFFKVAFFVNPPYSDIMPDKFYVYVNAIDLPSIDMHYEEVNMYGYKTSVLTGTSFAPINVSFVDDGENKVFNFINIYRHARIPITRGTSADAANEANPPSYPLYSMNYNTNNYTQWFSANMSLLANNQLNVFHSIKISVAFFSDTWRVNQYVLMNPSLVNIVEDKLSYETSNIGKITCQIKYDTFFADSAEVSGGAMLYDYGVKDLFYKNNNSNSAANIIQSILNTTNINTNIVGSQLQNADTSIMKNRIAQIRSNKNVTNNLFRKR